MRFIGWPVLNMLFSWLWLWRRFCGGVWARSKDHWLHPWVPYYPFPSTEWVKSKMMENWYIEDYRSPAQLESAKFVRDLFPEMFPAQSHQATSTTGRAGNKDD